MCRGVPRFTTRFGKATPRSCSLSSLPASTLPLKTKTVCASQPFFSSQSFSYTSILGDT